MSSCFCVPEPVTPCSDLYECGRRRIAIERKAIRDERQEKYAIIKQRDAYQGDAKVNAETARAMGELLRTVLSVFIPKGSSWYTSSMVRDIDFLGWQRETERHSRNVFDSRTSR